MKTPLHLHLMVVYDDGDIAILKKERGYLARVAHFSYNVGDSLERNILTAHRFMDYLEQGATFEEASKKVRKSVL